MEYFLCFLLFCFICYIMKRPSSEAESRYIYSEDGSVKDLTDPDYKEEVWELDKK